MMQSEKYSSLESQIYNHERWLNLSKGVVFGLCPFQTSYEETM